MFFKVLSLFLGLSLPLLASDNGSNSGVPAGSPGESSKREPDATPTPDPAVIIPQPSPRIFSKKEEQAACHKYEGRYISYYGDVYHVVNCKRRQIMSHISIATLARQRVGITPVDSAPIAAIPEGEPLSDSIHNVVKRTCKDLEGKYVTFSYNEIFYVQKCKKRLFPDWASYLNHRSKASAKQREILGLTWVEFDSLALGDEFPSSMDQEFAKMREQDKPSVMIPLKEACKGTEGRYFSFHSKMYLIESCKKRELDPEKLTRLRGRNGFRVSEMSSEQWLSLPDGKPVR